MQSTIAQAIALKFHPVALLWSDTAPENAATFKPGKWGCVMWLLAGAAKGKPAACDKETFGCWGGGVGMGFGNQYRHFPGGEACFCHFLSSGNAQWEQGRKTAEQVKDFMRGEAYDHFVHGEGYMKSPEQVQRFIDSLPIMDIPTRYVVFKPLQALQLEQERPQAVVFFVDPDQLSALVVLANYGRGDNENVIMPYAAGCQTTGIYAFKEAAAARPRGIVGLTDLSARVHIRKQLGDNLMTFTAPWELFEEMEANVEGSFLQRPTWHSLVKTK
jgi:hypothetical protein